MMSMTHASTRSLTAPTLRDRDRRKKEEKRMTENRKEKAAAGASARELIDDAILDKSDDPHEIMEVYQVFLSMPQSICDTR